MDRIHDSESNAAERELAALRKSVGETVNKMKRDHAAALADSLRHDKQLLVGLAIIFGLVIFHLIGDIVLPSTPTVTVTSSTCDSIIEGARHQRDRGALGTTMIRTGVHTHIDPACLTLVTVDWPDLSFDKVVEVCSMGDAQ